MAGWLGQYSPFLPHMMAGLTFISVSLLSILTLSSASHAIMPSVMVFGRIMNSNEMKNPWRRTSLVRTLKEPAAHG
jgi:hypothetical protein